VDTGFDLGGLGSCDAESSKYHQHNIAAPTTNLKNNNHDDHIANTRRGGQSLYFTWTKDFSKTSAPTSNLETSIESRRIESSRERYPDRNLGQQRVQVAIAAILDSK
jgi:hypothetical protein